MHHNRHRPHSTTVPLKTLRHSDTILAGTGNSGARFGHRIYSTSFLANQSAASAALEAGEHRTTGQERGPGAGVRGGGGAVRGEEEENKKKKKVRKKKKKKKKRRGFVFFHCKA